MLSPQLVLTRLDGTRVEVDAAFYIGAFSQHFSEASLGTWIPVAMVFLIAGAVLLLPQRFRGTHSQFWRTPFVPLSAMVCVLCAVGNWVLFPVAVNGLSSRDFANALPVVVSEQDTLYSFGAAFYGLSFYSKTPIYLYDEKMPTSGILVLNEEDLPRFQAQTGGALSVTPLIRSATPITKPKNFVVVARFHPRQ